MEYVFISSKDDLESIKAYEKFFQNKSDIELIKSYNHEAKSGIVGVRQQILYLLALRKEFLKRFNESPIYVSDQYAVGLTGIIELVNNQIRIKQQ